MYVYYVRPKAIVATISYANIIIELVRTSNNIFIPGCACD